MNSKNLTRALLLLLTLSPCALAADKISKETIEYEGKRRTYYLFAPASLKTPAPLVLLLHGSGRNGLSLVEKWKELAAREGFVVAGPDASSSQGWRTPEDGPGFIHELIEALKARYPLDPRRVYLFGHSAGAVFALNLAMMESEYFAAAAVHAGAWRERDEFSVIEKAKRRTPLAIVVGDRDPFFPLGDVRATEAALKGRGFEVEVTVMKGHDHWYYDLAPDINRGAWDFLARRALEAEPKYETYTFAGAGAAGDFNAAVVEINAQRAKARDALNRVSALEVGLPGKDLVRDRPAFAAAAREQAAAFGEGAAAFRAASLTAERASKLKVGDNYRQYLTFAAQADAKRAEALDIMKERAGMLLSDEPQNAVTNRMNEATLRAAKLNDEADELDRKAAGAMKGP
ncbi:MAG TPA: alpha/beta hydrolase-fold protein [Pyrinomonadaceae bacterium]|nr:alpha/beta hydrolase-fold protein [Pyrinomonadaceae bacterium]